MKQIKAFLQHKDTEAWVWMTVSGFIVMAGAYFADINPMFSAPILALVNLLTKYINVTYLKKDEG